MQHDSAINYEALNALRETMGDEFPNLVEVFIESTEEILLALEQAYRQQDVGSFGRHAHSLKSSAANLGGRRLSKLAAELERAGKIGALPDSDEFIESMRGAFDTLRAELLNS